MKILKIVGLVIGSFAGVFSLVFFTYPYINKSIFDEWIESEEATGIEENAWLGGEVTEEEFLTLQQEFNQLQVVNKDLLAAIDSLELVNDDLRLELEQWENMEDFMPVAGSPTEPVQRGSTFRMSDEDFRERVKSLLNLDEEELAPIVREMDEGQLVRLYQSGGTIQREKLLRALEPGRAASLMNEVML